MNRQAIRAILERVRPAQYADNPDQSLVALNPVDRQALIEYFDALQEGREESSSVRRCFSIWMPCGNEKEFTSEADIPFEDLPCPCGRKDHFFVKYSLEPLGLNELSHIT